MEFKVGDRVILKPKEELEIPSWKSQEVGVGIIKHFRNAPSSFCVVRWENGNTNGYRYKGDIIDLILKEPHMSTTRTIPSKDQVLKAASACPQTKDALKILFPQDFEEKQPKWPSGYEELGAFEWQGNIYFREELEEYIDYAYGASSGPKGYRVARGATLSGPGANRLPKWIRVTIFK